MELLASKITATGRQPSTGITRLQRYCEPLRHPTWPGLDPRGSPVGSHALPPRGASRVAWNLLVQACRRQYPGGTADGIEFAPLRSATAAFPVARPVGSRITCFEACSAFTRITACLLASRLKRPFLSKASAVSLPPLPLRLLPAGATPCRVGIAPTEDRRLFTAHNVPFSSLIFFPSFSSLSLS
jgi:hypothetical protein